MRWTDPPKHCSYGQCGEGDFAVVKRGTTAVKLWGAMIKIRQGIDITSVHRLKEIIQRQGRRFTNRVFTPAERNYCESQRMKYENYASRFAAKEAAMKAFEVPKKHRYRFREIGIRRHPTGKPYFHLSRISKKRFNIPPDAQIEVSMSHERDYAIATVVMIIPSR